MISITYLMHEAIGMALRLRKEGRSLAETLLLPLEGQCTPGEGVQVLRAASPLQVDGLQQRGLVPRLNDSWTGRSVKLGSFFSYIQ